MAISLLSDTDLWSLIVCDDYRAFTVLYQRHWLRLYRTAQKWIRDPAGCEEVVHDLFVTLWNRRQFLQIKDFGPYLKAALRYQVYAYLKKTKVYSILPWDELPAGPIPATMNEGHEKLLAADLEDQIHEQLQTLPRRCREVFLLSRHEHLSNAEIAERLRISKRTVENQLTAALKHLRFYLKDIAILVLLFWRG